MIDSIHAYDPNIKIALIPPQVSSGSTSLDAFNFKALVWAEKVIENFGNEENNVYVLFPTMSQGKFSIQNISQQNTTQGDNYSQNAQGVHFNGMGQLMHALYVASWILNMMQ
jgi:hypothetical protein